MNVFVKKNNRWLLLLGFLIFVIWSLYDTNFSLRDLAFGLPNIWYFISQMFPPDIESFPKLLKPALVTIEMAVLGTSFAIILSIPLGFIAARNMSKNKVTYILSRGIIAFTRSVPDIVFALIFISAVGLGPFPGTLALAVHSIGMLGKLYAEAVEEIDPLPLEAITSVGANSIQRIVYGVFPQVLPSFIATTLYRLDINIRSSVVLGLVGAGGIGFELLTSMRLFKYQEILSILVVIFIMVMGIEWISSRIRSKII
ncbi:MAG: phosphonate ABC transporter, permease protein PhnE [Euryarchaeota archaeon]|nr:phosphonate ABC transporter, permease protein PhnE [Euryarchaeota archaeon]